LEIPGIKGTVINFRTEVTGSFSGFFPAGTGGVWQSYYESFLLGAFNIQTVFFIVFKMKKNVDQKVSWVYENDLHR
jgi:hypothetical protein